MPAEPYLIEVTADKIILRYILFAIYNFGRILHPHRRSEYILGGSRGAPGWTISAGEIPDVGLPAGRSGG